MTRRRHARSKGKQGGQSLIEFTFVGIPLIFVLISTFEISRGMWIYDTLAYAAKQGVRYAMVHGANCSKLGNNCKVFPGPATNTCTADNNLTTQGVPTLNPTIAEVIRCAAPGLDPVNTKITLFSLGAQIGPCSLETSGANACPSAAAWPGTGADDVGDSITIKITTPFNSAIAMLFPGSKPVSFAAATLGAQSGDNIQY